MPKQPALSASWPQFAALLVGLIVLASAAGWVVLVTRKGGTSESTPRQTEPSNRISVISFDRPFPPEGRFVADPYIGSRVCAECHPAESAMHARSGHARTLQPAGRVEISHRLDGTTQADPELGGVTWSYEYKQNELHIKRRAENEIRDWIADYAIGSGHHALTYLSMIDHKIPHVLEHRLTYYRREGGTDGLGITPGHDTRPAPPGLTPYGGALPPRIARECFRCHATQIAAGDDNQRFDEKTMIPNVSCERCHGPAKAHVAAARQPRSESPSLTLPFGPDRYSAEKLIAMCGSCHRLPSASQGDRIKTDDPNLVRFQPVGITQSRCYEKSAGALSCVTCHDPHNRVSADRPAYDEACLSCHAGSTAPRPDALAKPAPVCPVSARSRCVECHMPRKDAGQGILFSDHWIRIHR